MSDLRFDPTTRKWVTIAENRRNRPVEFSPIVHARHSTICPFCAGNEDETPPPLATFDQDMNPIEASIVDEAQWKVRVVPNKFPAFEGSGFDAPSGVGPYQVANGFGFQELIIPTPRHVASASELTTEELARAFHAARWRIKGLEETEGILHAMLFLNCGHEAGASMEHVHFQLLGSPMLSEHLTTRVQAMDQFHHEHGSTMIEAIVQWEREQETRIVKASDNFTVFCPFASRQPLSVWIAPNQHPKPFTESDELADELAATCIEVVQNIEALLDGVAYNILLHQNPFAAKANDHWYLEIFPRMTRYAGYEWGTDLWINPVAPETAAKRLRVAERAREST